MTNIDRRKIAEEQFGQTMIDSFERFEDVRRLLPAPQSTGDLLEAVSAFDLSEGDLVADVGAWGGEWSKQLVDRYGCACIAVDISPRGLTEALQKDIPAVIADADVLPFENGSLDALWCRDTLSMLEDPVRVLTEFRRVLKPGGGLMLYTSLPTDLLEPLEGARLMKALNSPEWWSAGRSAVEEAVRSVHFEVMACEVKSPQYSEALLATDPSAVTEELLRIAQLRRGRNELEEALGVKWYEQWLAWSHWQPYLFLGKLETVLWLLRKPIDGDTRGVT